MAPVTRVEGRDPHQAMDAALPLQVAVGEVALDLHGGALHPRLLPIAHIQDLLAESLPLDPAPVHAEEHRRPVLRLGASGPGIDGDDRPQPVIGRGEEALLLERIDLVGELLHFRGGFGERRGIVLLAREIVEDARFLEPLGRRLPRLDDGARGL